MDDAEVKSKVIEGINHFHRYTFHKVVLQSMAVHQVVIQSPTTHTRLLDTTGMTGDEFTVELLVQNRARLFLIEFLFESGINENHH